MADLRLGPRVLGAARPAFLGTVSDQTIRVILDSSAIMALAEDASGHELDARLDRKRGIIALAAERLYHQGFFTSSADGVELIISGIDIDGS